MSPRKGTILEMLEVATRDMAPPMVVSLINEYGKDPFIILISCLLSLRAKDSATYPICRKLFNRARTPQEILAISTKELEDMFYKLGFFRKKALLVHNVCSELISRFGGRVPDILDELLSISGVGRKTAALVLAEGYDIPAICVDTHVHRLANHFGIVHTKTPHETELALQNLFPVKDWKRINRLFVVWGQNICKGGRSYCSGSCLADYLKDCGTKN